MDFEPVIDRRMFLRKAVAAGLVAIGGPPAVQSLLGFPAWARRGRAARTVTKTARPVTVDKSARAAAVEKSPRAGSTEKGLRARTAVKKTPRQRTVVSKKDRAPWTQSKK